MCHEHNCVYGIRKILVGVRGFEPPTPASRTQYSTRLSYTPNGTNTKGTLRVPFWSMRSRYRERRQLYQRFAVLRGRNHR